MRREWASFLVLLGLVAFASVAVAPPFETGLVAVAVAVTALLSRLRDVREDLPRTRLRRTLLVYLPLVAMGALVTAPSWTAEAPFVGIDGQINEAIIGEIADQAARGRPLTWLTRIAPGDPMLDLYPTLVHRAIAYLALWTGTSADLRPWMVSVVSIAYVLVSLGIARTSFRLGAPAPAAFAVAAFALLDLGSDFTWGTRPVFFYGFLPSTISIAITLHTLPSLFDLFRRQSRTSFAITALGFGIATAMHPLSVVLAVTFLGVLLASITLGPADRRRALVPPFVATALGLLGSMWVWAPSSERIISYGVHYGTPQVPLELALERMVGGLLPDGGFAALISIAWLAGVLAFSRREAPEARILVLVAALFVFSYVETAFLDLALAPSTTTVRWQSFRIGAVVKPFIYVLGAYAIGSGARLLRGFASDPVPRRGLRLAALVFLASILWTNVDRWSVGLGEQAAERENDMDGPVLTEPAALDELRSFLEAEVAARPGGRLLLVCELACSWELFRFSRVPGIPIVLRQPAPAGFLLRDQLFTMTPENLRRFGIRWVVTTRGDAAVGDPDTERVFDRLTLREIADWDPSFAHVAEGRGVVEARTVQGEGFDITLSDTDEPALVELGTPYYPRLVAEHESGRRLPVYALPVARAAAGDPNPQIEHAVALWLPPGTTRLRATGPLPSDGRGSLVSLSALLGALVLSGWRRARLRATELVLGVLRWRWLRPAGFGALVLACGLLVAAAWVGPAKALRFGVALPRPRVFVVSDRGTEPCVARSLGRRYACPDEAQIAMVVSYGLQDWHVGWPVPAPAVEVRGGSTSHRYVLELPGQRFEGGYLGACQACVATLRSETEALGRFDGRTARVALDVEAPQIEIRVLASEARLALMASRFVDPPFAHPLPPAEPPASP